MGYFRHTMNRYAFLIGIEKRVYPHCLRHSRIKELRRRGYSWERIMSLTGHASIMSLSSYIHAERAESLQKALDEDEGGVTSEIPRSPQQMRQELIEKENQLLKAEVELLRQKLENRGMQIQANVPRMDNTGYL